MKRTYKIIIFLFIISIIFNITTIYRTVSTSKEYSHRTKMTYQRIYGNLLTISGSLEKIQSSKEESEIEKYFHSAFFSISHLQTSSNEFDWLTTLNYNTSMGSFYNLSLKIYGLTSQEYVKYIETKEFDYNKIKFLQQEVDNLYSELKKVDINDKDDLEKIHTIIRKSNIRF